MARKSSVISIDDFVEDAAKQFDQLTDGSDFSLDDQDDNKERNEKPRYVVLSPFFLPPLQTFKYISFIAKVKNVFLSM